jgi:hypothetical protein
MPEWVSFVGFLLLYLIVMKWVLPKLGVPTCMANSCAVAARRKETNQKPPATPEERAR